MVVRTVTCPAPLFLPLWLRPPAAMWASVACFFGDVARWAQIWGDCFFCESVERESVRAPKEGRGQSVGVWESGE